MSACSFLLLFSLALQANHAQAFSRRYIYTRRIQLQSTTGGNESSVLGIPDRISTPWRIATKRNLGNLTLFRPLDASV